ncbi:GWT1-domain-containing protein [Lyophyllum atratum]|nr:GWT1-domain-containing protein [Lyophyllum atratum]
MTSDYKEAKEHWVSDLTGSTISHVNLISLVALVFANSPGFLSLLLLIPTGLLLLIPRQLSGTPLPSPNPMSPRLRQSNTQPEPKSQIPPLPSVTVYRAHMILMTLLAILAVDFPVFPRSLAKCETFGVSLMDLGVGSFVFSQGLVSAIPLLKDPSYLSAPAIPKILSVTRKTLPIILIGLVRVLLVKGTEYPEHESEYGTHWNFFITLALLPILQVILHPVIMRVPLALLGISVAVAQQITLSFLGVHDFVLNAPRTGLISANKEGLASLPGNSYVVYQVTSLYTSLREDAPAGNSNPNDKRNTLAAPRENDHTAIELCSYTVVYWTLLGLSTFFGIGGAGVSRRMVNIPYILWVAAFNTSFILGYLLLDIYFFPSRSVYSQKSKLKVPVEIAIDHPNRQTQLQSPPPLLEAINKNGLVLFLVANVATGLINITVPTMYTSDFWAMVILNAYTLGVCGVAWIFRGRRILQL